MEQEIIKKLYRKYYKEIYLYLLSLCHTKETAEDLVQETFVRAMLSLNAEHANMRAWLYLVARNLFYNEKRRTGKIEVLAAEEIEEGLTDVYGDEVLDEILADESRKFLFQAMEHIGERQREVLVLYYFNELSFKEIAGLMKLSLSNVRVLAHRGKQEIRKYMEGHHYELS